MSYQRTDDCVLRYILTRSESSHQANNERDKQTQEQHNIRKNANNLKTAEQ